MTAQSRTSALENQGTDNFLSDASLKEGIRVAQIALVLSTKGLLQEHRVAKRVHRVVRFP